MTNWIALQTDNQLEEIKKSSDYSLIFKHSTRCSVSLMAKKQFELYSDAIPEKTAIYYLDLLNFREISNQIATLFSITHQSPQVLLIKNGECIFTATHSDIDAEEIAAKII
ncbi:MAG: bacillithiol system redox-active protein YtxJ [Sphingobacteriaceae bacterium]|nr:bacillithiol system redox-active protein YtxJ [Sphingobacteriaceae bacterium]